MEAIQNSPDHQQAWAIEVKSDDMLDEWQTCRGKSLVRLGWKCTVAAASLYLLMTKMLGTGPCL